MAEPFLNPHIRGWGEDPPEVTDEECRHCGKAGAHDVIVLGTEETVSIVTSMTRDLYSMRRTT